VKSRRNTTGSHYIELYPGLLHFVYVDRLTNRVTAPSLVPVESPHDEGGKQMDIKGEMMFGAGGVAKREKQETNSHQM
jgi:hypothetical protein